MAKDQVDYVSLKINLLMHSNGRCPVCGRDLNNDGDIHHRKMRSQGGGNEMANLALVHRRCHTRVHLNPAWAYAHGFLVRSTWDPSEIAMIRCVEQTCEHMAES